MNAQPRFPPMPMVLAAAPAGQEPPTRGSSTRSAAAAPDPRGLIAAVRLWEELQRYRIQVGNQLGAIERAGAAVPIELAAHFQRMEDSEKDLSKLVLREWNTHPLAPWISTIRGVGLTSPHNAAVLVAMLDGDPYIAYPKHWEATVAANTNVLSPPDSDEPEQASEASRSNEVAPARVLVADEPHVRTVSQLWQFCGYGNPGKRRRGMTQEEALALGKPLVKSRLRLIAVSLKRAGNETYCAVYDIARANVAGRVHEDNNCTGRKDSCYAKAGEPWKLGHQHAHALRIVAKRFLQDLYDEAKRLHESGEWR